MKAQGFNDGQGLEGTGTDIEGAVEGERSAASNLRHQLGHQLPVHVFLFGEGADDDAVGPQ